MSYGARLAYGCRMWTAMALLGTYGGLKLHPLFGLAVPRHEDSSC
jgi:hypothetical protein